MSCAGKAWAFHGVTAIVFAAACLVSGCRTANEDFYPIGIYGAGATNNYPLLKQTGFNVIRGAANQQTLDAARAAGLKVLATPGSQAGKGFDPAKAKRIVESFDHHPALWGWYIVDEPDLNRVSPQEVRRANRTIKRLHAKKPTLLTVYDGNDALYYADIPDIMMIDRYPVAWTALAHFGQSIRQGRLAAGIKKPLIAIIQSFDWKYFLELSPIKHDFRPPTYAELRCMTYDALANRANGLFYYAFQSRDWDIREHPGTWASLQAVVEEVNERLPLFKAEHQWWPYYYEYENVHTRLNDAIAPSVTPALLRVKKGNATVPSGLYVLTVNTTELAQGYRITIPYLKDGSLPVLGENRSVEVQDSWLADHFDPLDIHVYGPIP